MIEAEDDAHFADQRPGFGDAGDLEAVAADRELARDQDEEFATGLAGFDQVIAGLEAAGRPGIGEREKIGDFCPLFSAAVVSPVFSARPALKRRPDSRWLATRRNPDCTRRLP
jgi:hypothetical protein